MNKSHDFTDRELIGIKTILLMRQYDLNASIKELYDLMYTGTYSDYDFSFSINRLESQLSDTNSFIEKINSLLF